MSKVALKCDIWTYESINTLNLSLWNFENDHFKIIINQHFFCSAPSSSADDNECSSSPCVNGRCQDAVNGYVCICNAGWTGINCDVSK